MNESQDAFVLHRRPYRNNSFLVDFFTREQGIIRCVARGGRGAATKLSAFQALWINYRPGRSLASLNACETQAANYPLSRGKLFCGMYLNELLTRLLMAGDPYPELFAAYQQTLHDLSSRVAVEPSLRRFEIYLLDTIGYGLPLDAEFLAGEHHSRPAHYQFIAKTGFIKLDDEQKRRHNSYRLFTANELIGIAQERFDEPPVLLAAKRLLRLAIDDVLEGKPLLSRELFKKDQTS